MWFKRKKQNEDGYHNADAGIIGDCAADSLLACGICGVPLEPHDRMICRSCWMMEVAYSEEIEQWEMQEQDRVS